MIDGFKLRVTSSELKQHCTDRSGHHTNRANDKEATLPELRDAMEKLRPQVSANALAHMNKVSTSYHMDSENPVQSLEQDIRDHRNKSLVFAFFASHLFDEDYTLDEAALKRLEIIR